MGAFDIPTKPGSGFFLLFPPASARSEQAKGRQPPSSPTQIEQTATRGISSVGLALRQ